LAVSSCSYNTTRMGSWKWHGFVIFRSAEAWPCQAKPGRWLADFCRAEPKNDEIVRSGIVEILFRTIPPSPLCTWNGDNAELSEHWHSQLNHLSPRPEYCCQWVLPIHIRWLERSYLGTQTAVYFVEWVREIFRTLNWRESHKRTECRTWIIHLLTTRVGHKFFISQNVRLWTRL